MSAKGCAGFRGVEMIYILMIVAWLPASMGLKPRQPTVSWVSNLPSEERCEAAREKVMKMAGDGLRIRATCLHHSGETKPHKH